MNKVKLATVAALAAALVLGAACGSGHGTENDDREILINCYDPNTGKLVKKDDDCHDDGLTAIKPQPTPLKTSGGMQTAGPAKTKAAPRPTRR